MTALVLAIELDRILNGLDAALLGMGFRPHRPGEHHVHRLHCRSAGGVLRCSSLSRRPVWFIVMSGLCFFAWGEIFSLFPSITGDLFGKKWATTNYGIVYTAKGLAAFFAGLWLPGQCQDRLLDRSFLGDDCLRPDRRVPGPVLAEAGCHPHLPEGTGNASPGASRGEGRLLESFARLGQRH